MRPVSLLAGVSTLVLAGQAMAETHVTGATTTPQATATAASGAPDDLTIDAGGSVNPTTVGPAVTLNSSNVVSNLGGITITGVDNATGVLALGGNAGSVTNAGTIQIDESSTNKDNNNDGILDGPFATGTGRYGIRVIGPGVLTGTIANSGTVTVTGNSSSAISVETGLNGALSNVGTITVVGANSFGVHTTSAGSVSGTVTLGGTISATGEGAQAANIGGDVVGAVVVNGSLVSTGYESTIRPSTSDAISKLVAGDLLQGGSALTISSSIHSGILVDVGGAITTYGSAPAMLVGGANPITMNDLGSDTDAYGLEIRGAVAANGVYDKVTSTGLQLGVTGGGTVNMAGGVRIVGSVTANGYAADAVGIDVKSGVSGAVLRNDGVVTGTLLSDAQGATARGVLIESGANIPGFVNTGTISAAVTGTQAFAAAVVDKSGSITHFDNTSIISATITGLAKDSIAPGQAVAVDLSANTTGVIFSQYDASSGTAPPAITGDVLLGSGADQVSILSGTLTGNLSLGAGANSLTIDGGSSVTGALTATGGTVALNLANGSLDNRSSTPLNLTSLNVGATSSLVVTADPLTGSVGTLRVNGAANIATGAKLGIRLASILQGTATYNLVQANQLTVGTINTGFVGSAPYLYDASSKIDTTAGTVAVTLSLKSAAELQLSSRVAAAYSPILDAVQKDPGLRDAFLAQTTRAGLISAYNQMLPNYSGSVFQTVLAASDAFSRPIDDLQTPDGNGFWMQEVNFGMVDKGSGDLPGYKTWGIGLAGGYELPATNFGVVGLNFGLSSSQIDDDHKVSDQNLTSNLAEGGVYWRGMWQQVAVNARLAGDYMYMGSRRELAVVDSSGVNQSRTAKANWSALGVTARVRASYEAHVGFAYLRPQASADFFRLAEGSYGEKGGGDGFDLHVDSRTSTRLAGFAGLATGAVFGDDATSWGPEVLLGYRQVATQTLGKTTARFESGTNTFTLDPQDIAGGGAVVRLALKAEQGSGAFALEGGAEKRDDLTIYDLRATAHFRF